MKNVRKIILILLLFPVINFGQVNFDYDDDWETYVDWDWDWDQHPFMELSYGFGKVKHKDFSCDFTDIGLAELKLGFLSKEDEYDDFIIKFRESFALFSNLSTDLSSDNSTSKIPTDMWRFGFGRKTGYGYQTSSFAVLPYYQSTMTWSRFNPSDPITISQEDLEILDRYRDNFRFGTTSEGGIRLEFADFISINGGYETAVVFPRHLFWKHAGSFLIEAGGHGLIDWFVNEILDSSPAAAPVVNFLLHNGLSFAFHTLKREDMNWPFKTETPLTYETVKIGMTFTF